METEFQGQCPEILLASYQLDAADWGDSGHSIYKGFSVVVDSELSLGLDLLLPHGVKPLAVSSLWVTSSNLQLNLCYFYLI